MAGSPLDTAADTLTGIAALPPPAALAQLHAIATALPTCASPERLDRIASALPGRVAPLSAEVCLALAGLARALALHGPRIPDDLDDLEPRLRVEWLRVQLAAGEDPEAIEETLLLRAVQGWSLAEAADPCAVLDRMVAAADPRLRSAALDRLSAAIDDLAITPEQACAWLLSAAADVEPSVRRAAFGGLAQRLFIGLSPARAAALAQIVRAGLDDEDRTIVRTCVGIATRLGACEWLAQLGFDEHRGAAERIAAIEGLGPLARAEDLDPVLQLGAHDPLEFGACTRRFVLEAHRHGTFIRDAQIPALLAGFDGHHGWTGEALVRVAHIARARLLTELAELPANDRRWIRRAAILGASVDPQASRLTAALLRRTADPGIAAALIDAAGSSPDFDDELALLAWLAPLPERVIAVLRVKGGAAALAQLRVLVEDHRCPTQLRANAINTAWALSRDRKALLEDLCKQLGPHAAGLLDPQRASGRDGLAAAILSDPPWPPIRANAIEPLVALSVLCEAGKLESLPAITRSFRAVFSSYVGEALAGDFTIKRVRMPELEQRIYRYGRHLITDGRSVRRWIEATPDTGRELILALAITWLHEDPPAPVCVALLETIARQQPTGASLRQIEGFWRHRDPEVQRAALEALLAAGEGARGLELSIARLSDSSDARILRQALIGIESLAAGWAEPMVIDALARPEMAIKKAAATALAIVGTSRCVPALVEWIGVHDNSSFRALLLAALHAVAKTGALAILVDAHARAEQPRQRSLLRQALAKMASLAAILRLARSPRPSDSELVRAALDGELALSDASPATLAAALHRAKLRALPAIEDPSGDPSRRLRLEGFSSEAALALLETHEPARDSNVLAVVRAGMSDWLRWLDTPVPAAINLCLAAATPAQFDHLDALLELAESAVDELDPPIVVEFIERCVVRPEVPVSAHARSLAILRRLPLAPAVGGPRRFALLAKLGAVRGREDLERCLAECRIGPALARDSEELLCAAFSIPAAHAGGILELGRAAFEQLEQLRERAKAFHRASPPEAEAWLSELLATRPLDLPALAHAPKPEHERSKPAFVPSSRADLERLLALVHAPAASADRGARERAAEQILAWPDAQLVADSWAQVLEVYLAGAIDLSRTATVKLAATLEAWPEPLGSSGTRLQAGALRSLFEALGLDQRRRFLPAWIAAWERAEPDAEDRLRSVEQALLIPAIRARAAIGDYALLGLLRRDDSLALRELVEFVGEHKAEVAHLIEPPSEAEVESEAAFADPLAGLDPDALVRLIHDRNNEIGLAVRAVHALTRFDDRCADALAPFTLDPRSRVRSAALRGLRKVATRERYLDAIVDVIEIETREGVLCSLLASIGHGRHTPGIPRLLDYAIDRDPKLRKAAHNALLAWGGEIVPALRRASSKARPDRRSLFEGLIDAIERAAQ